MNARILSLVVIGAFHAATAKAGYGTNSFFVTIDTWGVTPAAIEQAKTNSECRPAEEDAAGHWGRIAEGYQLSIRFEKETFRSGEPVPAKLIFRNASTNYLLYATPFGADLDFEIRVVDQNGRRLPDSARPTRTTGRGTRFVPGTQFEFVSNLMQRYGLAKPGTYSVSVHRKIPKLDGTGWTEVVSGTAKIRIVPTSGIFDKAQSPEPSSPR
jgi:hypothetical protein